MDDIFQCCQVTEQEATGAQEILSEHREMFFCFEGDWALAKVAQRGCDISFLVDLQKPSEHGPDQHSLGHPARAGLELG